MNQNTEPNPNGQEPEELAASEVTPEVASEPVPEPVPATAPEASGEITDETLEEMAVEIGEIGEILEEVPAETPAEAPEAAHYVTGKPPKPSSKVSMATAIGTTILAVVLAVLLTFSLTATYYVKTPVISVKPSGSTTGFAGNDMTDELYAIDKLFRTLTVYDLDDEALLKAVLKAYVEGTGDTYAEYFTKEELEAQISDQNGEFCGIGVSVLQPKDLKGADSIYVLNVYVDSPAEEAGVLPGDSIIGIGEGDDAVTVEEVGYTNALQLLKGEEGTEAVFTILRDGQELQMRAIRRKLTVQSVLSHVYAEDPTVGVVRLTGFDNPTAEQFKAAMDDLIAQGCTSFVLDMRNNPGGLLTSVEDIATFFLQEDDVILHTRTRAQMNANEKTTYTVTVSKGKVTSGSGTWKAKDVGCYAQYPLAVLINENTASAAELFTAVVRDHELGVVVGAETSFGKGIMQTTYLLSSYGYEGALKLTTAYYDPPTGENYQDKGITPDILCELSEEEKEQNLYLLTDETDTVLRQAVAALQG